MGDSMIILCQNTKCIHHGDDLQKLDDTNCRTLMWDEIDDCPESISEVLEIPETKSPPVEG
jgi:hypothetical protein